jgi:hypothetical protein
MELAKVAATKFHLTVHARQRIAERGLSVEAMKDVVKYPQHKHQQYQGEHGGTVFRFSNQRGQANMTVVAEIKGQQCWLITGWI